MNSVYTSEISLLAIFWRPSSRQNKNPCAMLRSTPSEYPKFCTMARFEINSTFNIVHKHFEPLLHQLPQRDTRGPPAQTTLLLPTHISCARGLLLPNRTGYWWLRLWLCAFETVNAKQDCLGFPPWVVVPPSSRLGAWGLRVGVFLATSQSTWRTQRQPNGQTNSCPISRDRSGVAASLVREKETGF